MGDLTRFIPSWTHLLILPGIIAGFTVHELSHTLVAYLLGDHSQVERGRLTLNPLRHISWFGTLTFVFFGFGWARPVQMDARHFKRRYPAMFLVAISGAAGNLVMAGAILALTVLLVMLVAVFTMQTPSHVMGLLLDAESAARPDIVTWAAAFTTYTVYANLALAFFNLLPFPTLDGFTALLSLIGALRPGPAEAKQGAAGPARAAGQPMAPSRAGAGRRPADIHFELGAHYHEEGNYEDAIARYRQAIAHDGRHGPAHVNLGLAYLALNQRDRAIHAFRGATQHASDEKSRNAAWAQLHKLSEAYSPAVSPGAPAPAAAPAPETAPWTDTQPGPNWVAFGLSGALTVAATGCLYIYLTIGLIRYLSQ
jgi:Zn-dependent protease